MMRIWLHTNGTSTPEFNGMDVVGPGVGAIEDLRTILDLAYFYDVSLLLCLWSFDMLQTGQLTDQQRDRNLGLLNDGDQRGGIITIGWHMNNPATGGNACDTDGIAVPTVLPGGENHEMFKEWLDRFASFAEDLTVTNENGESHAIPVLFRPYHEMTRSWFWWGSDHISPQVYIDLWQFTVDYLQDEKGLNNLLYSYSPDVFDSKEAYLERYPGNEYVDIMGYNDYRSICSTDTQEMFVSRLVMLVEMAEQRDKIPVMTETGVETIPDSMWWTDVLLAGINANDTTRRIAYVLTWRNANHKNGRPDHYYAPFDGHPSEENFRAFRDHPLILFEEDLPDLYSTEF